MKKMPMPWDAIDTVLLDMDGTILDLHFDNYFWSEYLPKRYSEIHNVAIDKVQEMLLEESEKIKGKLEWYCLDYWSDLLSVDISALKNEIGDKVAFRTNALEFLRFLNEQGKRVILATNAHPKALELKLLRADFTEFFEHLSSSHDFGYPKEDQRYWQDLMDKFELEPSRCLFIDDSLSVLESADEFGIGHLIAITQPDSTKPAVECPPYNGILDFNQLI